MCYLLFMPASQLPSEPFLKIPHFDKIVHFSMFFILCILMFRPVKQHTANYYFWAPLLAFVLAVLLESVQHRISVSRHTDALDLLANTTGLLAATLFFRYFVSGKKLEQVV
jgi:VanZ family protein